MAERRAFGISAALTTPFGEDGAIDIERLCRHAIGCIDRGCASVTLFGTTGEGPSIGLGERRQVLDAATRSALAGGRLVYGIAASAVDDALAHAQLAEEFGCRRLLVTPPFYFGDVGGAAVLRWYQAFFAGLSPDGPEVILYNIPQLTGVPVPIETVAALRDQFPDRLAGVKDSSGDWDNARALLAAFPDLAILIGDERLLERGVRLGAAGSISGVANFRADMLNSIMAGAPADPALAPLVEAIAAFPATPAVKALGAHMTGDEAWRRVRPPLTALTEVEAAGLARTYGMLVAGMVA